MSSRVFISYSSADKIAADQVCSALEASGTACWIAPRDIDAGTEYAVAILEAIEVSTALLLVFSSAANASQQVKREVERAASKGKIVLVVRIEDVKPTKSLEYFTSSYHWLDVFGSPLEPQLESICSAVNAAIEVGHTTGAREWPHWDSRLQTVMPDLEKLKADRRPIKLLFMTSTALCIVLMLVGMLIIGVGIQQSSRLGFLFLLLGLGGLPPCSLCFVKQQSCADAVNFLSIAVRQKNEEAAREAIERLTCFPKIRELLRHAS